MKYERPTTENVVESVKIILEKEYDKKTVAMFLLGFLRMLEEEPDRMKIMIIEQLTKII